MESRGRRRRPKVPQSQIKRGGDKQDRNALQSPKAVCLQEVKETTNTDRRKALQNVDLDPGNNHVATFRK